MSSSKRLRLNRCSAFVIVLVVLGIGIATYNYLQTENVEVFIETNSKEEELFIINTAINYYGIESTYTTGAVTRVVKSGSVQRLPIQLDNILLFHRFYAWVYHPDYIHQVRKKDHRSIFRTVTFPKFTPIPWVNIISNNIKISISESNNFVKNLSVKLKAIESGELIRIVDVLKHLRLFKEVYIPLYQTQGSIKKLRRYLPRFKELVSYTKANIEVDYDQLDEHDREYLRLIDQSLMDIEEMIS